MKKLLFGDNLEVMREHMADESVDLVYLDPPFNSDARYNTFWSKGGKVVAPQAEAFRDTWSWEHEAKWAFDEIARIGGPVASFTNALYAALGQSGTMAYLVMMAVRLYEIHRVMKPTASLYLHCDPTASHYLKVMLDGIFGAGKFRNEVVWKRTFAHGGATRWGDIHDTLLFYTKSDKYTWNRITQKHDDDYVDKYYKHTDDRGRYSWVVLTGPNRRSGASGQPWRGYDPTERNRHWSVPQDLITMLQREGVNVPEKLHDQLDLLHEHELVRVPVKEDGSLGRPVYKKYLAGGQPIQDIVLDVPPINSQARERLGYPTQKPVALLERIIRASSNEGDVVFDPFCGCGTTIHAAEALGRGWVGVDVAYHATEVIAGRLKEHFELDPGRDFAIEGRPNDFESAARLAERDKHQFQWFANYLVGVNQVREVKRGPDRGIDGEMYFAAGPGRGYGRILTSVKGGKNVGVGDVRDFRGVLEREGADGGVFVCLRRPTRDMRADAASAGFFTHGNRQYPRLQIVSLAEWYEDGPSLDLPPQIDTRAKPSSRRKARKPDAKQGEMLLTFAGERQGEVVHLNPRAVAGDRAAG